MSLPAAVSRELYPFASHYRAQGALKQHYLDEGRGPAVVMVHGNPTWSFYYRDLVRALSGTHRVIVPDHIGMGLSDKPDDSRYEYTLQSRVDDVATLLEHLGITGPKRKLQGPGFRKSPGQHTATRQIQRKGDRA